MIRSPVAVKPHVPRIYSIVGDPQPCLVLRLKPSTLEMFSEQLVWTQELALSTLYSVVERILMRFFKLTQLSASVPSTCMCNKSLDGYAVIATITPSFTSPAFEWRTSIYPAKDARRDEGGAVVFVMKRLVRTLAFPLHLSI